VLHEWQSSLDDDSLGSQETWEDLCKDIMPVSKALVSAHLAFWGTLGVPWGSLKGWFSKDVPLPYLFLTHFALISLFAINHVWATCLCDLYIKYDCSVCVGGCAHSCFFFFLSNSENRVFRILWASMQSVVLSRSIELEETRGWSWTLWTPSLSCVNLMGVSNVCHFFCCRESSTFSHQE
jgi:hypothetical protein